MVVVVLVIMPHRLWQPLQLFLAQEPNRTPPLPPPMELLKELKDAPPAPPPGLIPSEENH